MSKFGHNIENPFHISVAALLTSEQGEICVHHFQCEDLPVETGDFKDLYILMRETLEDNETIENGIARGLMEEYGATGKIVRYIGSIQSHFPYQSKPNEHVEKTTLYFHVQLENIDEAKRETGAVESKSKLIWMAPRNLSEVLQNQSAAGIRGDVDDYKIVQDFIKHIHITA